MHVKVPMQGRKHLTTHIISRTLSWLLLLLLPVGMSVAQSSVSLLVIGDGGTGGRGAIRVGEAMAGQHAAHPVQTVISTGDNIYNSGVKSVDDPQWQSKFERVYPADKLPVPFWAVLGNHDYRGNPDAQVAYTRHRLSDGSISRWRMPGRHWTTVLQSEDASLRVRLIGIDTQQLIAKAAPRKAHLAWIDSVLALADEEWIFVIGHHMVYSHGHYGNNRAMVKHLAPLLEKHGVHAYLNGHEHDLQLLHSINDVRYIISGAAGGTRKTGSGKHTEFSSRSLGFFRLDLDEARMRIRIFNDKGKLLHESGQERKVKQ